MFLQARIQYSGNLNGEAGFPMYDTYGDNCLNKYAFEGPGNFMIGNIDATFGGFENLWASCYRGIGRANVAIENITTMPSTSLTSSDKDMLLGQALFLRALFYMNLAVYFQDVPLVLKVQTVKDAYVPKNSYKEVSDQIIEDLTAAAEQLPPSYPDDQFGYATKGAALGLLARFLLYNHDYQGVLDATTRILPLGYKLNPSYEQLFTLDGEMSDEIVFSVKFAQNATTSGELFSGTFPGVPKVDEQPMPNLVNDYYCTDGLPIAKSSLYKPLSPKADRDERLIATVYFKNDIFLKDLNKVFTGNTATGFGRKKYIRNSASATGIGTGEPGGQDFIVIRYADILLMRAEAMVELNQLSGVYALVNQVRARVNMPDVEDVEGRNLSQDSLRTIVRHERRVELACEGLRYFDLKRWGEVRQAFQRATNDKVPGYTPLYEAGKSEIFPIPQPELDADINLVQNPVWLNN